MATQVIHVTKIAIVDLPTEVEEATAVKDAVAVESRTNWEIKEIRLTDLNRDPNIAKIATILMIGNHKSKEMITIKVEIEWNKDNQEWEVELVKEEDNSKVVEAGYKDKLRDLEL